MNRSIYPIAWAELNKSRAGEKYRPSNATEGDVFMNAWCNQCARDKEARKESDADQQDAGQMCQILTASLLFLTNEEGYPAELQYRADGQPCCTAFAFDDSLPDPRCTRTMDLFAGVLA